MEEELRRGVNPNIPHDIVEEILVKLPVKSLGRFKAVSREWRGAIESNSFVEKHMRYQNSIQGGQVRFITLPREGKGDTLPLENLLLSTNGVLLRVSPYPPILDFPRVYYDFTISTSCDGLFCLFTKSRIFHLINPATTSHRILPDPISEVSGNIRRSLVGIGRENSASRRYKLVCYFNDDDIVPLVLNNSTRCKVFALNSNSWRYVDDPPIGRVNYNQPMMHLDRVIYSLSYLKNNHFEEDHKLLAFDLHKETFQSFPITPDIGVSDISDLSMGVLNHHICIFNGYVSIYQFFFKIWGLDVNKRSWEILYSINASCIPLELRGWEITLITTINKYVVLSIYNGTIWGYSTAENNGFLIHSSPCHYLVSYVETLVSTYQ